MPDLSPLYSPAPYHIISYGTLLGSQLYQSFVAGIIAFRTLERPQFRTLQQAVFPVYFSLQTTLPVLVALTFPGEKTALGSTSSSLAGVLAEENRFSALVPLVTMFVTGLLNLAVIGPKTVKIIQDRQRLEIRDNKKSYDSPPHSKEMTALNKSFGRIHSISLLINFSGLFATLYYGFTLAKRIQ